MVVFDTTTILLVIDPTARPPIEPGTTTPVSRCAERVDFLLKGLSERGVRVMVPTPVIAEFLVKGGKNKDQYAQNFIASRNFVDFDIRAAIELVHLNDPDLSSGKQLDPIVTKAKIKFDRQVVAIAKVEGADTLYTHDTGLRDVALANGLRVVMTRSFRFLHKPRKGSWTLKPKQKNLVPPNLDSDEVLRRLLLTPPRARR